jgi:2-polyprenyl-3-methyl-5-hydroxy-6-metoxy-1,4-benzoquinol methylase
MNVVFRAIRFGAHLAVNYPGLLVREIASFTASICCWPMFVLMKRVTTQSVEVRCESPVAADSPDHKCPHGTAENHMTHYGFITSMRSRLGPGRSMLDLGCSSGRLVRDFRRVGWTAVGLEGSDYSLKARRPCWDTEAHSSLFTCDIGKPFEILNQKKLLVFDLITCFQVLEHLDRSRLECLMKTVESHSRAGTLFVISTANNSEVINGVELHVTQWDRGRWIEFFQIHLPKFHLAKAVPDCLMPRRSVHDLDFLLRHV